MSRLRFNWRSAVEHIHAVCPALSEFISSLGPGRMRARPVAEPFVDLCRAVTYQQLSGKAAATILGRLEDLFTAGTPNAEEAVRFSIDQLRTAGLSRSKALSILDLAEKSLSGELPRRSKLVRLDDDGVIETLCRVRGVGPWTAQMYLMFCLGRPDVMPATDLGVQKGVQRVYSLGDLPSPDQVLGRTAHLAPFRTAASWYFWRAADQAT